MEEERRVDHMSPEYIYRQVADLIAADIASGRLAPGARLAGERAMAEQYGVAIGTVRRAVEELRQRGLVVTLPARGTFIKPPGDAKNPPPEPAAG